MRYTLGDDDEHFTMPYGFARGLDPEEIVGASDDGGRLKYLVKWKDFGQIDIVLAKDANQKCPQTVIAFWESKVLFGKSKPHGYFRANFDSENEDAVKPQ